MGKGICFEADEDGQLYERDAEGQTHDTTWVLPILDPEAPCKLTPPQSAIVASSRSLSPLLMACISRKVHLLAYPACHSQSQKCLSMDYGTIKRALRQARLSVSSRLLTQTMPSLGLEGMLARAGIWPLCRSNS